MKFRKKPVVIEAEQFHESEPLPFRNERVVQFGCECGPTASCWLCSVFWVQTLEGPLRVDNGDWIIRGAQGEFYPCKPDIFAATYEPVDPTGDERCPMCRLCLSLPASGRIERDAWLALIAYAERAEAALENVRLAAVSGLSFGHNSTPISAARMVERKDQKFNDVLRHCAAAGVVGSLLRETPHD